jgi:hypothetical protein
MGVFVAAVGPSVSNERGRSFARGVPWRTPYTQVSSHTRTTFARVVCLHAGLCRPQHACQPDQPMHTMFDGASPHKPAAPDRVMPTWWHLPLSLCLSRAHSVM